MRHMAQRPQPVIGSRATRSPTFRPATPAPTAATVPAPSWPMISGTGTGLRPTYLLSRIDMSE